MADFYRVIVSKRLNESLKFLIDR